MSIEPLVLTSPVVTGIHPPPATVRADREWLMAYAAALSEHDPARYDTTREGGVDAHPLFPVCLEWPSWLQALESALPPDALPRGVHATHELRYHRPIRQDESLRIETRIVACRQRRSGLHLTTVLRSSDEAGNTVFESRAGLLLRGISGEEAGTEDDSNANLLPARSFADEVPQWIETREAPVGFAHVYTACARIWNPIHTDLAVARRAGLDDIILHGTATLALAVSAICTRESRARPARRITARFLSPVTMPTSLRIERLAGNGGDIRFRVRNGSLADAPPACIGTISFADP
ncbi:hypothetical protein E2F46_07045 [Luteimonas aestuarii]|uniref:MaoC-like domain-containing protein n=1 Tax=Luteimonas aestuarii TaxID=453837 RepID=A0A4R5TYN9_9GAMM|nr:MaoC/PaaZ C-terminal domain-containing protein [Luteimonas aestuarii]TDK26335.1 hypothetical protein E2F46_07045 [Luteimonas aestuarii]